MKFTLKYFSRRLAVSAIIFKNNKILLIRRENEPYLNRWCFPGGKIENNETYIDATIREVKEEIGLEVIIPENHLVKISYSGDYMIITSLVEIIRNNKKGNIPYEWFSIDNLPEGEYVPGIKEIILKASLLRNMYNNIYKYLVYFI